MQTVDIVAKEDHVLGGTRFAIEGIREMQGEPTGVYDGSGVAHDLFEHQNGLRNIGRMWDEIQALGACFYTRGWTGAMQRDYHQVNSVQEGISGDLISLAEVYCPEHSSVELPVF